MVGLVAVVMLSLHHRDKEERVPVTSWNLVTPPDLLVVQDPYGSEPVLNLLKPNITRDSALFNAHNTIVDRVKLGMNYAQVVQKLGQATEINGNPPTRFEARFPGLGPDYTSVSFVGDGVVSIQGETLLVSKRYGTINRPLSDLTKLLGKNDYLHHTGYGGTPTYCWAAKDVVLEVNVFETAECEEVVSQFHLGDPNFFVHSPHLWWTGCGGVEEELQAPRPAKLDY